MSTKSKELKRYYKRLGCDKKVVQRTTIFEKLKGDSQKQRNPTIIPSETLLIHKGSEKWQAKCIKSLATKNKELKYFVQYIGRKKGFSEWISESQIAKSDNELGPTAISNKVDPNPIKLQPNHNVPNTIQENPPSDVLKERKNQIDDVSAKTKLKNETNSKTSLGNVIVVEEVNDPSDQLTIELSSRLISLLKYDQEVITKQKKLWILPSKVNVDTILDSFIEYNMWTNKLANISKNQVVELAVELRKYFNKVLVTQLLYEFERPQSQKILLRDEEDPPIPSAIYGTVHLVRLFIKIGNNLSFIHFIKKDIELLKLFIEELLNFITRKITSFYDSKSLYVPSLGYINSI